jgi:hypothetical protein
MHLQESHFSPFFCVAFQITASEVPSMDREGRRVVGQLLDEESMVFLARLASLPTRKGFKGVIPGQNFGPPLIKISLGRVEVKPLTSAGTSTVS